MNAADRISVVIPVHNGAATLPHLLKGLRDAPHSPAEVIVVDDGSDDMSAQIAVDLGARLISLEGGPHGPAYARNRGAEAAGGDVLFFLDTDVTVHEDTVPRLRAALRAYPKDEAFFGSYDAHPPAPGLVSKYKNLLHHYVHQHSQVEADTFWAGCGAIRRDAFFAVGGFDESYGRPTIEDIELGMRLRQAGYRIRLCPDIQVTHRKRWTLASWLRTDICHRAVPWTRLILNQGSIPASLNLNRSSRWSALLVWLTVFLFLMVPVSPLLGLLGLLTYGGFVWLNWDLIRFFAKREGRAFALGATLLQSLYLAYSSATFGMLAFLRLLERRALYVLLLATLFNGLVWSVATPPLHGPDENYHFSYVQLLANERTLEVRSDRWLKEELGLLMQVGQYHIRGFGEEGVKTLDLSDPIKIQQQIEALKSPSVQSTYHDHDGWMFRRLRGFVAYHPPFYYAVIAGVHMLLSHQSILVRLLAGRWTSVVLALVSVWAAYRIGEKLWPRTPARAALLGVLVAFQPMHTFVTSIVNNGALEIALFSLLLLVTLEVVDHGLTVKRGVQIGLIVGLGLLTRISFLASLPVLGLLLLRQWGTRWSDKSWRTRLLAWIETGGLTAILAGWWYLDKLSGAGRVLVDTFRSGEPTLEIPLLSYLVRYGWLTIYRNVLKMYWGNFGWLHTPLPDNLRTVLILLTVIAAWSGGWWLLRKAMASSDRESRVAVFRFTLLGLAALSFVAFYTYLDYRFARRGGAFGIQGRYFLPPIAGQMAWLLVGLSVAVPKRVVKLWQWLLAVGMVILNGYALYAVIVPRYYPIKALMAFPGQAALLQPLGPLALKVLMLCQFLFAALLLVALLLTLIPLRRPFPKPRS
jgi:GT2 family glycosyltransferase